MRGTGILSAAAGAALAAMSAGCAPVLSTMHPATVANHKSVDAGMGYGVSVPVAGVVRSVDTAKKNVERTEDGIPLSDDDRDEIIKTSLGLVLNPPSFGAQYRAAYGIFPKWEIDLRYAVSSWRIGTRYQVLTAEPPSHLVGSVGIGFSRYVFSLGVPDYLEPIVKVDDFTRYDIDVPVLFGISHDIFHVWGGPKLVASFMSTGFDVCTQIDTGSGDCTARTTGTLDGRVFYFAGQAGAAVGYKYVWIAAELTAAYADVQAGGTLKSTATTPATNEKRDFHFGDVIVYPVIGIVARF